MNIRLSSDIILEPLSPNVISGNLDETNIAVNFYDEETKEDWLVLLILRVLIHISCSLTACFSCLCTVYFANRFYPLFLTVYCSSAFCPPVLILTIVHVFKLFLFSVSVVYHIPKIRSVSSKLFIIFPHVIVFYSLI